jgi:hypothetical protein
LCFYNYNRKISALHTTIILTLLSLVTVFMLLIVSFELDELPVCLVIINFHSFVCLTKSLSLLHFQRVTMLGKIFLAGTSFSLQPFKDVIPLIPGLQCFYLDICQWPVDILCFYLLMLS